MSKESFKLSEISAFLGGQLTGDGSKTISKISTLLEANNECISFIYNKKFKKDLEITSASAVLISKEFTKYCPVDYILVANPHEAYAKLTQLFSKNLRKKASSSTSRNVVCSGKPSKLSNTAIVRCSLLYITKTLIKYLRTKVRSISI